MKQATNKTDELAYMALKTPVTNGEEAGMYEGHSLQDVLQLFTLVAQRYTENPPFKPDHDALETLKNIEHLAAETECLMLGSIPPDKSHDAASTLWFYFYALCIGFLYGFITGWLVIGH